MDYPSGLINLSVDRLHPHPDNPRKDLGDLTELAASIKENGIFQNLTVVVDDPANTLSDFTVIIGHRRLEAAKLAGLTEVPCVVVEMTPKEQLQTMLLENMQRADLTVYEQAQGFQMMLDLGSTVEEIAEKSGFSQKTVRRRVKMMELDQKTLKEVSERQLSLGDFDTLAQIEDIKARNKALESIGTSDFNAEVSRALKHQNEKKNLPLVKAWLKEVGAKKITQNEAWSNNYESYPGCGYYIYLAKWGEDGNKPPKDIVGEIFYVLDTTSLKLYKKREKAKPVKKSAKELAYEKEVREAWKSLNETAVLAYDLRKQFVEKLHVTAQNRASVLLGAFYAGILHACFYNSADSTAIRNHFGFASYEKEANQKVIRGVCHLKDADLPKLIYAMFGDNEKVTSSENTYSGAFPNYAPKAKLHLIYEWLHLLGYESSSEEIQLLDGTHPAYHAEEAHKRTTHH